ncbi:hypothetical protein CEXT_621991 [Caerostris extrusa]|uniref:Uncharacterized protein n=1 Tax=Caerostris extrusa TaxID=172846 RepID=A0AAV4Y8K7_CAEEX|nr:hypothetical protein CEXT_621991 [Caerostris extrusa]
MTPPQVTELSFLVASSGCPITHSPIIYDNEDSNLESRRTFSDHCYEGSSDPPMWRKWVLFFCFVCVRFLFGTRVRLFVVLGA